MTERGRLIGVALAALLIGAGATAAVTGGSVGTTDRAAIERIVREYILTHPEILPEAMTKLQEREVAVAVKANRAAIETPFAGAWAGAADGDVTLVEFFDYSCGYCRASLPDVDRLLAEDKKLRVVYREMPVLGPESEAAARMSLVAAQAGKYMQFHKALFAQGRDPRGLGQVSKQLGLDPVAAKTPAVQAEIDANLQLQRTLNLSGTPSWIVGDKVLAGAVGYDALKAAIAEARKRS